MTTITLAIKPGQKWRTVTGRTVRITAPCGMHGYQFSAEYYGTRTGSTYYTDKGISIGRDDLAELLSEAPEPKPAAPVVIDEYLSAAIDDELVLAELLGWQNFAKPGKISRTVWLMGTHNSRNGHVRNGSVPMPAWRRDWSAGELISRCKLTIAPTDGGVAVHAETGPVFRAIYSEHPSEDDAIRFAMCKAAIAYLRGKS